MVFLQCNTVYLTQRSDIERANTSHCWSAIEGIKIINNYWTRLSKILWFVSGGQINYLQIIDLRDTDKSWSFVITEFNNCFIIQSPRLFSYFNHYLAAQGSDLPFFSRERDSYYAWAEYYFQRTRLDGTVQEQTITCRQLFEGHAVGSRPNEWKGRKKCIEWYLVLSVMDLMDWQYYLCAFFF